MKRREFITLLGGGAAAWPLAARGQVFQKRPLIAVLGGGTRASSLGVMDAFRQGMRELGYVEDGNFDMVYRYADGYAERLPALAQEVVRLKPDVILAPATGQAVVAKKATGTTALLVALEVLVMGAASLLFAPLPFRLPLHRWHSDGASTQRRGGASECVIR
jgi:putative ABC transport system substrate-binding protein